MIDKRYLFVECACGKEIQALTKARDDWDAHTTMSEALRHYETCALAIQAGLPEAMVATFDAKGWDLPAGVERPASQPETQDDQTGWRTAADLPLFSANESRCEKCAGEAPLLMGFCPGGVVHEGPRGKAIRCNLRIEGEHLHRRCTACAYEFGEQVASASDPRTEDK